MALSLEHRNIVTPDGRHMGEVLSRYVLDLLKDAEVKKAVRKLIEREGLDSVEVTSAEGTLEVVRIAST